jgi:Uma2 family endonuclease
MEWSEVCDDEVLQDLPYKVELNEWGKIVMSPASNKHGFIQTIIAFLLMQIKKRGNVLTECSIQTSKGVKVADVVWGSDEFFLANGLDTPYRVSPEICVEIVSPSNTSEEMNEKKELYFARGTKEVWFCDEKGKVRFYGYGGEMPKSEIFDTFPSQVVTDFPYGK